MALVPPLQVVPIDKVLPHEEVDPLRVESLMTRIQTERVQVNPVICVAREEMFIVLDGATRTESFRQLGMRHVVVQVVDPDSVQLETWNHVIREARPTEVLERITSQDDLLFHPDGGRPRVTSSDGDRLAVSAASISPNATLSRLVGSYTGTWTVSRIIDPAPDIVDKRFPDWSVVVEFPTLEVDEVLKGALGDDLLPAGITRFLVPERVLRLNLDLDFLQGPGSQAAKQATLETLVENRSRAGRVRRYEESVIILDD